MNNFQQDIALISHIPAVPTILDVICKTTGMGFAAVARVTEDRWIACSVLDTIEFGLRAGGELKIETTICHEIHQNQQAVIINHVAEDPIYCKHPTPAMYGFQSYISVPIILSNKKFFGTLCAIDSRSARVQTPEIIGMFKLFAELLAFHIDASEWLAASQSILLAEREASELREQFIAVLGHDLRNPLSAISSGTHILKKMAQTERSKNVLDVMQQSVARMVELIENVVDFARGRLGGGITLEYNSDAPLEPALRHVIA